MWGYVCDVSMPTFMLTHWHAPHARGPKLPLELLVKEADPRHRAGYGLHDRGLLAPGMKADVNIIDFTRLQLDLPHFVFDLAAGGRRLTQSAQATSPHWSAARPSRRGPAGPLAPCPGGWSAARNRRTLKPG